MSARRIALVLESLQQPFRQAVATAARLGYSGAELAARGALAPSELSQTGRREVRHLLQTHRRELAAVACPLDRGLDELPDLDYRLAYIRQVMELAANLGPRLAVVAAGAIPAEASDPAYLLLKQTLADLARHGDRVGCRLALTAGLEPPERLRDFIRCFDTGSLGIHVDPALLISNELDPAAAVGVFASLLWHVHARDCRPRRQGRSAPETPLGGGDVDWFAFLGALAEIGYAGWLAVKQRAAANPVAEAERALAFLRALGAGQYE
jgi:L-ribulose-5-phosphate 3-epimerase